MGWVQLASAAGEMPWQKGEKEKGKSGLHRVGWPLTAAPSDRRKVPQKRRQLSPFCLGVAVVDAMGWVQPASAAREVPWQKGERNGETVR